MKYVEASQFGGPEVLTVKEKETPKPGEGMLLVEVQAAGVNYAAVAARLGSFPAIAKAPFFPGFEVAGVVDEVGKGVKGFNVGDSVAAITSGGGYASRAVIPAAAAIPIPPLSGTSTTKIERRRRGDIQLRTHNSACGHRYGFVLASR